MDYGVAPEASGPAEAWLKRHESGFGLFIGGEWIAAASHFDAVNPATAKKLASIGEAGAADVDAAVRAARAAQPAWAKLGGHGRARFLYALARLVQKHARLFAVLETMDNGKPIRESRDVDIPLVARHFYHHAGWAQLIDSEFADHEPLGVVGQVIPWNFPLLMLAWKIAPALAAGNTVVLKPAEDTSLTALLFAEICEEAGLPKGVVNIVTGAGETGKAVVEHPGIDKIAFTGSAEVGRLIRIATAGTGKKLTLELSGKSPFVVFEDADLDAAVEGAVDAIWFNQGQVLLRRLAPAGAGKHRRDALRQAARPDGNAARRRSAGQEHRYRRHRLAQTARPDRRPGEKRRRRRRDAVPTERLPGRLLLSADAPHRRRARRDRGAGRDLRPRPRRDNVPHAGRGRPARQQHALWPRRQHLEREHQCRARPCAEDQGWGGVGELHQPVRRVGRLRRLSRIRLRREGGREGMCEYLKRKNTAKIEKPVPVAPSTDIAPAFDAIDRTAKLFIGGKQARPDSGYSRAVLSPSGAQIGLVGDGNRKDIRNAVEAAAKAESWASTSGHARAQILYYCAENLSARADEFAKRLRKMTGASGTAAMREVEASIRRLFTYAAWADKFDGAIHDPPLRGVVLAMNEPLGVIGIACPDTAPLLGFVSLMAPAVAMGNRVVMIPSERHPLAATDFYQVLETSDVPDGVVNIVTGARDPLALVLAEHGNVDAVWYFGASAVQKIEAASAGDLKRTWCEGAVPWLDVREGEGRHFLRHATQVKNIWIPYGA